MADGGLWHGAHGLCETWTKSRTQRINLLRGIFREMGLETPVATAALLRSAHELVERPEVVALRGNCRSINLYEQCMVVHEQQLQHWHADDAIVRRLDEISRGNRSAGEQVDKDLLSGVVP